MRSISLAAAVIALASCTPAPAPAPVAITPTHVAQTSGTTALLIAVSPVNENVVWVSGQRGTWVRTIDGGTTWQTGQVPGAERVEFRDVHGVDANTAYLLSIGNGATSRVYKTVDAGKTWALQITNADSAAFYDCMGFWDANHGILVGDAVKDEMYMMTTSDGGAHWTRIPASSLPKAQKGEGSFASSGTCLTTGAGGRASVVASIGTLGRLLRTTDYGKTWKVDTLPGIGGTTVEFRDASHGFVLGGKSDLPGGPAGAPGGNAQAAVTSDGGKTWMVNPVTPLTSGVYGAVSIPGSKTTTIVAVGPPGLAYTRNNGVSWTSIDAFNYWAVAFASPKAGWAVGTGGRITKLAGF